MESCQVPAASSPRKALETKVQGRKARGGVPFWVGPPLWKNRVLAVPAGEVRMISRSWASMPEMFSARVMCSAITPWSTARGMRWRKSVVLSTRSPVKAAVRLCSLAEVCWVSQVSARRMAAWASTRPKP